MIRTVLGRVLFHRRQNRLGTKRHEREYRRISRYEQCIQTQRDINRAYAISTMIQAPRQLLLALLPLVAIMKPAIAVLCLQEHSAQHVGVRALDVAYANTITESSPGVVATGGEKGNAHALRLWTLPDLDATIDELTDITNIVYSVDVALVPSSILSPDDGGVVVVSGEGGWDGSTSSQTLKVWQLSSDVGLSLIADAKPPTGYVYTCAINTGEENITLVAAGGFDGATTITRHWLTTTCMVISYRAIGS